MDRSARWQSESSVPPSRTVVVADDRLSADAAYRLACEGTAILWQGDFQNARQLLQAMARRFDRKHRKAAPTPKSVGATEFHLYRQAQVQRVRILGMLLLAFDDDYQIPLRRAPDVRSACMEAYGPASGPFATSLRELQGLIGAHEWRKNGVSIPELGERIHPHYGVFAPIRSEYVGLVETAPIPDGCALAFDIGTGTGVLAAVLAKRGVSRIVATDQDPRALACAADNLARLGLAKRVEVMQADLFPGGCASLIVCNPPWLPGRAGSSLERAVYDPDSRMLMGFIKGLTSHLAPGGEGWLVLSDLAEHLGLRTRAALLAAIDAAGLKIVGRMDVRPNHPRSTDSTDPLYAARAAELTSLWRLALR
ncbi:MAG: class I SAM-dependent methyltransferase [Sulfuritalea sp.]|nr:class I SAM-dependent methyltransferase [Sulfuritalea sp.]